MNRKLNLLEKVGVDYLGGGYLTAYKAAVRTGISMRKRLRQYRKMHWINWFPSTKGVK